MLCVLPGVFDVRAKPFRCSKELMSEDFPTFERPRNAISGKPSVVQCSSEKALLMNSAEVIFINFIDSSLRVVRQTPVLWEGEKGQRGDCVFVDKPEYF